MHSGGIRLLPPSPTLLCDLHTLDALFASILYCRSSIQVVQVLLYSYIAQNMHIFIVYTNKKFIIIHECLITITLFMYSNENTKALCAKYPINCFVAILTECKRQPATHRCVATIATLLSRWQSFSPNR